MKSYKLERKERGYYSIVDEETFIPIITVFLDEQLVDELGDTSELVATLARNTEVQDG